ncbi:MAG TPA: hypothetical protein PK114_00500 [Smithellaceae bacterium]|nr:hypothetical protein [Smithellaceae bacterium]
MRPSVKKLSLMALFVPIFFSVTACSLLSTGNYGKFVPDSAVTAAFSRAELNPEFHYYITGSDTYPRSILGLHKDYVFDSPLWKKVAFKPDEFKEITARMQHRALDYCRQNPFGFAVTDSRGNRVGVWYSIMVNSISMQIREGRKIFIYPPNDIEYRDYDGQGNQ